jgi:VWFA-related protein
VRRLLAAAVLLAAPLVATPLLAQTHSETITVEVVDVPVYVIAPNGPVTNLTKSDFELYVNGKRQTIDYFDTIDFTTSQRSTANAPAPPPRDVRDRRMFLLMFDLMFSRPVALARAQRAAVEMIRHAAPTDYFAVATFTASRGAQFASAFTNDAIASQRAVLQLRPSDAHDGLGLAIAGTDKDFVNATAGLPTAGDASPSGVSGRDAEAMATLQEIAGVGADLREMPVKRLIESQVANLGDIAKRLAPLEGYKHVVFLSEGFNHEYATGLKPKLLGPPPVDAQLFRLMDEMNRAFHAAGVLVDTVDLGLRDAASSDVLVNESLSMIANGTGGQFIHNRPNTVEALGELSRRTSTGYRLGFRPHDAKKGENAIDVKVHNVPASAVVSYRRGFSTTPAPASANVDPLRLADILLNDTPQTGVAPKIGFGERPYLLVAVPSAPLLAQSEHQPAAVRVLLYVFDAHRNVVAFKEKALTVPADAKGDLVIRTALKLGSGAYTAKALLIAGEAVGFNKQNFRIP